LNNFYHGDGCLAEATINVPFDSKLEFATQIWKRGTNFEFKNIHADENLIPDNYEIGSFVPLQTAGKF
jgi:hypothetical protein